MPGNDNAGAVREGKSNRGFASMAPERQREIASLGGRAAHRDGTAHEFTTEEAREAGRKGGEARAMRSALRRALAGNVERAGDSGSMHSEAGGMRSDAGSARSDAGGHAGPVDAAS